MKIIRLVTENINCKRGNLHDKKIKTDTCIFVIRAFIQKEKRKYGKWSKVKKVKIE